MRLGDLLSPAMDVLNSIKVTIPPELREMLLEFVVCYLIDRPTDPHSYAAAHFIYQQKLRHSHMVRYPYREPGTAPVQDNVVRKEVTPPQKPKDSFLWEAKRESEVASDKEGIFPKMLRIIDDRGRPYGEKLVERLDDVFDTAPEIWNSLDEEGADETAMVEDEVVEEEVSLSEEEEMVAPPVVLMDRATQTDVDEEEEIGRRGRRGRREEKQEEEEGEEEEEDEEEEEKEEEQEEEKGKEKEKVKEKEEEKEEVEEKWNELGPEVSASAVAAHTVVQLLHSTYQTITDTRFSYAHQMEEPEEEPNTIVEAQ